MINNKLQFVMEINPIDPEKINFTDYKPLSLFDKIKFKLRSRRFKKAAKFAALSSLFFDSIRMSIQSAMKQQKLIDEIGLITPVIEIKDQMWFAGDLTFKKRIQYLFNHRKKKAARDRAILTIIENDRDYNQIEAIFGPFESLNNK